MDLDLFDDLRPDRDRRARDGRRPRDADDSGRWRRDDDDDDDDHHRRRAGAARDAGRSGRGEDDDDRGRSRRDDDRRHRRDDYGRDRSYRRAHPHVFAWALMAGGALVLGLLAIALIQATGLMGPVADLYFTATTAVLPGGWHDEWTALPGAVHVLLAVAAIAVVAGVAGEALEFLD
ncbi:MAG: hypothetical protein IPL61_23385 [Myxococcales bacterium]|nr:hypothetical protein [Myxococcales bacterium]